MGIAYFTVGTTSNICEMHKELFLTSLKFGTVVEKFVDTKNHSFETVVIKEDDKLFTLLLVPDANGKDFERLTVNGKITKTANSFLFKVNNDYQFEFKIDCIYDMTRTIY